MNLTQTEYQSIIDSCPEGKTLAAWITEQARAIVSIRKLASDISKEKEPQRARHRWFCDERRINSKTNRDNESTCARWLKTIEAADYARVTVSMIRKWIAEGALPVSVTRNKRDLHGRGGGGYVLDRHDIDKLMDQLKVRVQSLGEPRASGRTGRQRRRGPEDARN